MFAAAFAGSAWLTGSPALASELTVRAPDACAEASEIRDQVDGLLGRPLAAVEDVDFEVEIAALDRGRWTMKVETLDRAGGARRTREIAGKTCPELADAAAVAIAMSIQASRPPLAPAPAAPPPSSPVASPAPPPVASTAAPPPAAPRRLDPTAAVAVLVDAGSLPGVGPGAVVEAGLTLPVVRLRLLASAAVFVPRAERGAGGAAGSFDLAFGALAACAPVTVGRATALACLGGELGRLAGEGEGVARPRLGSALWQAARAEVGVSYPLAARLSLVLRAGVAAPLSRPVFVVDGATRVYQPAALAARGSLALEVGL